jgi:hypothetical protein
MTTARLAAALGAAGFLAAALGLGFRRSERVQVRPRS